MVGEADGSSGIFFRLPRIAEHYGYVGRETGLFCPANRLFQGFRRRAFVEPVNRILVDRFQPVEYKAESGTFHEHEFRFFERARPHVAANGNMLVVPARNHSPTKRLKPLAYRKRTRIVKHLFNAEFNERADLIKKLFRLPPPPCRKYARP